MTVDPIIQAEFERNLSWKRSWPRCLLGSIASIEAFIGVIILLTECCNILMDFWHTNIFGGIWASIIVFINVIVIYATVCCITTIGSSTCALIWNLLTLLTLGTLIAFDVIFILNPDTCFLTPTCSTQSQIISLNYIMQMIPPFKNYTSYDSKKIFLEIQVGCAGVACIISFIYIVIYIACKMKIHQRVVHDYSAPVIVHPPPVPIAHSSPIAMAPPSPYHHYPTFPVADAPQSPWINQTNNVPYPPY
ncbi:unnamed protein product [Rotaria sp. Silwood2]|nr:unnamed protein product [Rotaria sp. Silwood2]CAF2880801.1 unnamed protein product [Rotaria sp. Silwood2]CAF4027126.1 unnamed protein product [Rotaria sp. Silwood2]CAF4043296.1 unnamed protein product [Rotaria sp. Silwood2]CAF4057793.1 unnamed protein product [Rotaria sp. Silwood2]